MPLSHSLRSLILTLALAAGLAPAVLAQPAPLHTLARQTAALAATAPPPFTLNYTISGRVKGIRYTANSVMHWQPSGAAYQLSFVTRKFPLGSRTQTSAGAITAHGLAPQRMTDDWRRLRTTRLERAGSGGTIHFANPDRAAQALIPGAQDQVSLAVHMAALLNGSPQALAPGKQLAVQVAGLNGATVWLISAQPRQTVQIGGTSHEAVYLRQIPQADQSKTTEVWMVPWQAANGATSYLPARIRVSESSGDYVEEAAKALPQ